MGELDYKLSEKDIKKAIECFDNNEKWKEIVLSELFSKYHNNTRFYEILVKVTTLNSLYSAGLNNNEGSKTIDVVTMAKHILLEPRMDSWLNSDDDNDLWKAYEYIAYGTSDVRDEKYNKCYAFASKYCSWHRPDKYPIMDSRAKLNLENFIKENSIQLNEELNKWSHSQDNYKSFWEICKVFQNYINSNYAGEKEYSLKDIDKFLWQYGKKDNDPETSLIAGQTESGGEG